jgi:hypothetical protein
MHVAKMGPRRGKSRTVRRKAENETGKVALSPPASDLSLPGYCLQHPAGSAVVDALGELLFSLAELMDGEVMQQAA